MDLRWKRQSLEGVGGLEVEEAIPRGGRWT